MFRSADEEAPSTRITDKRTQRGSCLRPQKEIYHPFQMIDGAALLDEIAGGEVPPHFRIPRAPEGWRFWVEPDESPAPFVDQPQNICLRIPVIIPGIAQNEDRCLIAKQIKPVFFEISKYLSIIGSPEFDPEPKASLEPHQGLFNLIFLVNVADLNKVRAEYKRPDPGHCLVEAVKKKQHKPCHRLY